jgi:hypothetical protein
MPDRLVRELLQIGTRRQFFIVKIVVTETMLAIGGEASEYTTINRIIFSDIVCMVA